MNVSIVMEKGAGELSNHLDEEYEGIEFSDASRPYSKKPIYY